MMSVLPPIPSLFGALIAFPNGTISARGRHLFCSPGFLDRWLLVAARTRLKLQNGFSVHVAIVFWQPISSSFANFVSENSALVHAVDAAAVPVAVLHRGAAHTPPPRSHRPHRCRIPRRSTSGRTTVAQHDLDHGLGPQQGPEARRGHARQ